MAILVGVVKEEEPARFLFCDDADCLPIGPSMTEEEFRAFLSRFGLSASQIERLIAGARANPV